MVPENNNSPLRRPPRLRMLFSPRGRALFMVTFNTKNRKHLLAQDSIMKRFCAFCQNAPEHAGVWVGRFVIMPDHVHVFVSAEGSETLSKWVASLKKNLSFGLKGLGFEEPFWQEGFFDHMLRGQESYSQKWEYVFNNPVRKGLVEKAEDWPFAGEIEPLSW